MITNAEHYAHEIVDWFLVEEKSGCGFKRKYVLKQDDCGDIRCRDCKQKLEEWLNAPYEGAHTPKKANSSEIKKRIDKFLEIFPDARLLYKHGIPTACVRDIFGQEAQPTCTGLTCRQCWHSFAKES